MPRSILKIAILSVYLWQRAVELVNGVHHIQQHVVADHKFTLQSKNILKHPELLATEKYHSNATTQVTAFNCRLKSLKYKFKE